MTSCCRLLAVTSPLYCDSILSMSCSQMHDFMQQAQQYTHKPLQLIAAVKPHKVPFQAQLFVDYCLPSLWPTLDLFSCACLLRTKRPLGNHNFWGDGLALKNYKHERMREDGSNSLQQQAHHKICWSLNVLCVSAEFLREEVVVLLAAQFITLFNQTALEVQ